MIVKRKKPNNGAYTILNGQVLITKNNSVQKKLSGIPLSDICLLLNFDLEKIKEEYEYIQNKYDYSIIELLLDNPMLHLNYFHSYKLTCFEDALVYEINIIPDKVKYYQNYTYLPISLVALAFFESEERMLNKVKLEMNVIEDNGEYYISESDFIDYYQNYLDGTGIEADVTINCSDSQWQILIERKLND